MDGPVPSAIDERQAALWIASALADMAPRLATFAGYRKFIEEQGLHEVLPSAFEPEEVRCIGDFAKSLYEFLESRGGFDDEFDFFNGPTHRGLAAFANYRARTGGSQ